TEPFDVLLQVQEHDTHIDQLVHRRATLPERAELAEVQRRRAELDARTATVRAERDGHGSRQQHLEEQIEAAKKRRAELEQRMYGGQAAARDLQAMDEEVRHLARHVAELEDRELEVMELLEPLDGDLQAADVERDALDTKTADLQARIATAEAGIDEEVAKEQALRRPLAEQVPPDLLTRYEGLRRKLGGEGAARLVGNSCTGCHLTLPAMEVDRIRKAPADAVITCDNCGRILVR
ncbi:MAG TPA: C4-type zinc ribbon domain-containing protein, partial [Acidimicrobiales bacterium]|nr:C4-type zinc ribbon domain-containing protein [Acidimicrobiales bacterium]